MEKEEVKAKCNNSPSKFTEMVRGQKCHHTHKISLALRNTKLERLQFTKRIQKHIRLNQSSIFGLKKWK
ncbi:hypothetical protein V1478_004372 [Vespula squamosa]|uniref:Uncharacterized protein n=1 Tax=Vespula squamosa TaxID=30214 RepID=A0ABD2BH91_VESSQ